MKSIKEKSVLTQLSKLNTPIKGRRILSWAFFLTILFVALIVPLTASIAPEKVADLVSRFSISDKILNYLPPTYKTKEYSSEFKTASNIKLLNVTADVAGWHNERKTKPTYLGLDQLWRPGNSLQMAHQPWSADCKACHSQPFKKVQDSDCKSCHKNAGNHVDEHQFKTTAQNEVKCTGCHKEHQGEDGLSKQNKHFMSKNCSECHANIKSNFKDIKIEDVSDFAKKHPDFNYQIAQSSNVGDIKNLRISDNKKLIEKTALKFPHSTHLDKHGIKSPKGKVTMKCADCHEPKADGTGFQPVTMKQNCQSCHDLRFEPAASNREVPHGSVEQILSTLREFYSYLQVNRVPVDVKPSSVGIDVLRPGAKSSPTTSFVTSGGGAQAKASRAATSLFEKTTCKTCHQVTRSSKLGKSGTPGRDLPQWEIGKITPKHPWLKGSPFNHAKHELSSCEDCHHAASSKKAEEVLMPSIKVCRDCHTGQARESNKIVSDCGLCHGFHRAPKPAKNLNVVKQPEAGSLK